MDMSLREELGVFWVYRNMKTNKYDINYDIYEIYYIYLAGTFDFVYVFLFIHW